MEPEILAAIIAAVTALVAVIVGPIVTINLGKKGILGPMRQAWINDLRDHLSQYLSLISISLWYIAPLEGESEDLTRNKDADYRARIQEVIRLKEKIFLLMNPNEAEHQELCRLVQEAFNSYQAAEDMGEKIQRVRDYSQTVLKKEWDVVKS